MAGAGHWPMSAAVVARTVTATETLVVTLPAISRAVALRLWLPAVLVVVSQRVEYGGSRTSEPMGAPSRRNWTPATATLSVAEAATVTVLVTVALGEGAVIATVGGVVSGVESGAPAALNAAICMIQ